MRINGTRPVLLVELRRARRTYRVHAAAFVLAMAATGAYLVWRSPLVLAVEWAALAGFVGTVAAGRPCADCGRWLRHALTCARVRP